jgi:hypothetical protein
MEYNDPKSPQLNNTGDMDEFFETYGLLETTPELLETIPEEVPDYPSFETMFRVNGTTDSPEIFFDDFTDTDFQKMDYGIHPQQGAIVHESPNWTTQASSLSETLYCRCCSDLSDMKR